MIEKIKAFVFDMDGVVIDTRPPIEEFWYALARKHGADISPEVMEYNVHGCPARDTINARFSMLTAAEREHLLDQCHEFEENLQYKPMPGIIPFLRSLQQRQIPVALVTSSLPPKVKNVLAQLQLEGIFDTIVTADLVERGKPDPACYRLAAKRLNVQPEACMAFEDAVSGLKSVVAAGMYAVGVAGVSADPELRQRVLREAGAQAVIPDFSQVRLSEQPANEWVVDLNGRAFRVVSPQPTINS
jgi:HAD superfamily hydrolase (TIGR01509 family)